MEILYVMVGNMIHALLEFVGVGLDDQQYKVLLQVENCWSFGATY